jgi:two-component system NtrC family sensor kinase
MEATAGSSSSRSPQNLSQPRAGLTIKLASALVASTAIIFGVFGWLNLRAQRLESEQMVQLSADRVGDIIKRSTRYGMMHEDRAALYQVIRDIGTEPAIKRVRIFNKEGRITFSTDAAEINHGVDKTAEQCYACHAQAQPLVKLNQPGRARIFSSPNGERVLAVIRPIENEPSCWNADCHAHSSSQQILGVIDTHFSLAAVDAKGSQRQARTAFFTVLAMALMSIFSLVFVWFVLHRPVREMLAGIHRVADGDLGFSLPVRSHDELGELAGAFNKMSTELASAHNEITTWNRTLEDRVARKTRELERTQAGLIGAEKMASLGKLAATVAHEVNNPLFGILTFARLALKDSSDEKQRERLKTIERESLRCGEIMRNLLTFARQTPKKREPNDFNGLVERALKLVKHQQELQQIELEVDLETDIPQVTCDAGQVQQVALVLMVNANEAMPQGGRLFVSTEYDRDDEQVRLRVRDTGCGITAEAMSKIFEPFFSTKEDQHRTGLGLAIAKNIIDQHGGTIEVQSKPGAGTEFLVTFPLIGADPPVTQNGAGSPSFKSVNQVAHDCTN